MANKKKNTKALVSDEATAPVVELELIPTLTQPVRYPFTSSESAEKTRDFDAATPVARNVETVRRDSSQPDARQQIEALRFDLEQSQARRRGLEKELEVRQEITASINEEIRDARQQLLAAAARLESLNNDYLSLKATHERTENSLGEMRAARDLAQEQLADRDDVITSLERQVEEANYALSQLGRDIDTRKARWSRKASDMRRQLGELEQLREENRQLRSLQGADMELELRNARKRVAEQAGELAALVQEAESLRRDNGRLESYANTLRMRQQDQAESARDTDAARNELLSQLETAKGSISELSARVAEEQAAYRQLVDEKATLKDSCEREIRQVQLDLQAAQSRATEQDALNEQLTSDLNDSIEFRQALETHVAETEARHRRRIAKLRREASMAKQKLKKSSRALRQKDKAIANLQEEIASQKRKISLTGELESALQKIDGFAASQGGKSSTGRSERVTRQLIGTADGKDVRFPLFRDRLTIGRTSHNDIQLPMRYISRRHAVIATDGNRARVIDWGSRNGVYVNNQRVTEKILEAGDIITIGLANLRYEEHAKR